LYTGRGKHAKKIFFVKSNPQNIFAKIHPRVTGSAKFKRKSGGIL
jgi:hypothetical protein